LNDDDGGGGDDGDDDDDDAFGYQGFHQCCNAHLPEQTLRNSKQGIGM